MPSDDQVFIFLLPRGPMVKYIQFEIAAMSITERMDLFNTSCKFPVTFQKMDEWITRMWTTRSTMTLVRKISLLMHERVQEPSDDIMLQYDASTRLVKKY